MEQPLRVVNASSMKRFRNLFLFHGISTCAWLYLFTLFSKVTCDISLSRCFFASCFFVLELLFFSDFFSSGTSLFSSGFSSGGIASSACCGMGRRGCATGFLFGFLLRGWPSTFTAIAFLLRLTTFGFFLFLLRSPRVCSSVILSFTRLWRSAAVIIHDCTMSCTCFHDLGDSFVWTNSSSSAHNHFLRWILWLVLMNGSCEVILDLFLAGKRGTRPRDDTETRETVFKWKKCRPKGGRRKNGIYFLLSAYPMGRGGGGGGGAPLRKAT